MEFDLRLLRPLVVSPGPHYGADLERARAEATRHHLEAARHLGLFDERLRDLAPDELEELYRETFSPAEQAALAGAAGAMAGSPASAEAALAVLERLLPRLSVERNPYAPLFKAICCLLIAAATASEMGRMRGEMGSG
jgi:nitrate reductase assembly molybdenum cofactor insertion protein NarJ